MKLYASYLRKFGHHQSVTFKASMTSTVICTTEIIADSEPVHAAIPEKNPPDRDVFITAHNVICQPLFCDHPKDDSLKKALPIINCRHHFPHLLHPSLCRYDTFLSRVNPWKGWSVGRWQDTSKITTSPRGCLAGKSGLWR